jgi:hypothetical protein
VLTALPGEDGSPLGATRATDAQYVAMSWRLAREFKLRGSGLLSRPQPPMTEGYRADGPLSGLRIPNLPEDAGEAARLWLLKHWQNPGAAKWLARADTVDRRERLSGALGLPHRSQPSCNLCFICRLAGEGVPPVHGLISQQATGDHAKNGAHMNGVELAKSGEAGVSASNAAAEVVTVAAREAVKVAAVKVAAEAKQRGEKRGKKQGKKQGRQQREEELRRSYGGGLLDVDRAGWERLLTHRQPKRARADEYRARTGQPKKGVLQPHEWGAPTTQAPTRTQGDDECDDMQTMTGQESLGASTRGQFRFEAEGRKQHDGVMNADFCNSSDPGDWHDQQVFNAGQGHHWVNADGVDEHVRTRPAMLSRPEGGDPRDYTNGTSRTVYTGGRRH